MGFWGIEVKPGKPYAYHSDNVEGKVHVTQATLGPGSASEKAILQCSARDNSPVYLCSLLPNKTECCPLDLEFEEDDSVVFSVVGSRSIHLAGKFVADGGASDEELYDSDSYGEDIADTETDDSNEFSSDDEYGGDFIDDDDDIDMFPPSPVPNSGVVIEEIVDDDKPTNENGQPKRPKKKKNQSTDSEDKKNSEQQIVVKSGSGVPVLESEDEDGFPISSSHKSEVTAQKPEAEAEQTEKRTAEKNNKKKGKDSEERASSGKRKVENVDKDGQPESDVRGKKKKKQQLKAEQDEKKAHEAGDQPEEVKDQNLNQDVSAGNDNDQKLTNENEIQADDKKKKKKKKKKKTQESEGLASKEQTVSASGQKVVSAVPAKKQEKNEPSQARTYGNGLVVEEIAMGKPNGKRASRGSKVSVRYIGKLQKNGKIFDSNVGGPPFKFRLGVGEVIAGWDVGVEGMRVGDKRRLTIPPAMGYGIKGAGRQIPPNAWLVFDVELIDVR